ncbi:hypothetical protein [Haladaptatus sp. CMAA 1911]|uniref:hypothetical protein n=1 Tax=unclassified Haladaptatus TaxID=2622732 RepID=UPI003754282D
MTPNTTQTKRELLRRMAATGTFAALGAANATATRTESEGPPRLLYTCDITPEDDPTLDVNDRLDVGRVEGTFGPTEADCFEERTLLYRYLFATVEGETRRREGIAWATRKRLPPRTYRIATIFVCEDAPSGYCAQRPFYGVAVRRVSGSSGN